MQWMNISARMLELAEPMICVMFVIEAKVILLSACSSDVDNDVILFCFSMLARI